MPDELRYAEGPTVEVDVLVHAPPATLWALVSDITLPLRFSGELRAEAPMPPPGPPGPSA